jgi:hypothetical protein
MKVQNFDQGQLYSYVLCDSMAGCTWDVLLMQSERLLPGAGTSDANALAIGTLAPVMGVN